MKRSGILLLLIIYMTFIALGLPDALLGSAWSLIRHDLNTSLQTLGLMTIVVYLMSIFSTFNAPRLLRTFQTKWITCLSVLFTGLALIMISQVNHFYQMLFFAVPLGIGAGAIDVSLNHYLTSHYQAKHMSYLHSFYGVGVTLGPTIMAATLKQNDWRLGYIIVGSLLLFISLILVFSFKLWRQESQEDRQENHEKMRISHILRTKGSVPSIFIFLIYVHMESLAGVWISSYFFTVKGVNYATAALFATSFYLCLTIGRILSGLLSKQLTPMKQVRIGEILMLIAALLMFLNFNYTIIYMLIVGIFGLGAGPIYPNMMYINKYVFDKKSLSKIMSLQMGIGYMGFGLLTPLAGLFFGKVSIIYYPFLLTFMAVVLIIITVKFRQQVSHLSM